MRRSAAIAVAALIALSACTLDQPPKDGPDDPDAPPAEKHDSGPEGREDGRMTQFFFYRAGAGGVEKKPSFVMRTPKSPMIDVAGEATLEQVQAEIYGGGGDVTKIRAERGRFDQETKTATMEGDVVLEREGMRIEMQDLVWVDEERIAKTDRPVRIADEGADLRADNLKFYPDDNALLLENLTGDAELAGRSEP